jgi:hypothetical protein
MPVSTSVQIMHMQELHINATYVKTYVIDLLPAVCREGCNRHFYIPHRVCPVAHPRIGLVRQGRIASRSSRSSSRLQPWGWVLQGHANALYCTISINLSPWPDFQKIWASDHWSGVKSGSNLIFWPLCDVWLSVKTRIHVKVRFSQVPVI